MKFTHMVKVMVLGGLFLVASHNDAMAAGMKRKPLASVVAHPFAALDKAAEKGIYDTLMSLDAADVTQGVIIAAVTAAVGNADVFARAEVKSKIDSVATVSFNKHVVAVQAAMTADFSGNATAQIASAGEAFTAWIAVFSADGGDTVKAGCGDFAAHLGELYDCVQGLIDAQAAYIRATAIVLVKQQVAALRAELGDGAEHSRRAARLALMPGQLEAEQTDLASQVLALQTIKTGRQAVHTVAQVVRDVDGVAAEDL